MMDSEHKEEISQEEMKEQEERDAQKEKEVEASEQEEKMEYEIGCILSKTTTGQVVITPLSSQSASVKRDIAAGELASLLMEALIFNVADLISTRTAIKTIQILDELRKQAEEEMKKKEEAARKGIINPFKGNM